MWWVTFKTLSSKMATAPLLDVIFEIEVFPFWSACFTRWFDNVNIFTDTLRESMCCGQEFCESIDWWIYKIMYIDWYWWVRIWSMPRSYTHFSSWGFWLGESVCRMKMRRQEGIELKNRWQWWSGMTGKEAWDKTIWTTSVSVLLGQHMGV